MTFIPVVCYNIPYVIRRTGGIPLIYNYNPLWKQLIDRGITKTQLKDRARVSTNIIAKMGKGEPVSMESLAKICTTLECGLDDIVEIITEKADIDNEH